MQFITLFFNIECILTFSVNINRENYKFKVLWFISILIAVILTFLDSRTGKGKELEKKLIPTFRREN